MRSSTAVALLVVRSWRHGVYRLTGGRRWLGGIAGFLILITVAVVWASSSSLTKEAVSMPLMVDQTLPPRLLASLVDNAALITSLVMTVLLVLSPSADSMNRLMAMSPISARDGFVGLLLPGGGMMMIVVVGLYGGPATAIISAGWKASDQIWVASLTIVTMLYVLVLVAVLLLVFDALARRLLAIPVTLARVFGSIVVSAVAVSFSIVHVRRFTVAESAGAPVHSPFNWPLVGAELAETPLRIGWIVLIVVAMSLVFVMGFAISSRRPVSGEVPTYAPLRQFAAHHPSATSTLGWQNTMRLLREPEVLLYLTLFLAGFGVLAVAGFVWSTGVVNAFAMNVAWLLAAGVALLSYGFISRARWVLDMSPIAGSKVMLSSDLSVLAICAVLGMVLMSLAALPDVGAFTSSDVLSTLTFGLMIVVTMRIAGIFAPYDRDTPLSATYPFALSLIIGLPVLLVMSWLPEDQPITWIAAVFLLALAGHVVGVKRHVDLRP